MLPNEYFLYAGHWYATIGGLIALNDGSERMLTPLPVFHMNAMAYSAMAMVHDGRLPDRARPLPPQELVGQRQGQPRHYRALSRRDAADADGRA